MTIGVDVSSASLLNGKQLRSIMRDYPKGGVLNQTVDGFFPTVCHYQDHTHTHRAKMTTELCEGTEWEV